MCVFHTRLHVMLFYTPSQIHNPSNIKALKIVNHISLPLIFFTPQWIFFFGHVSIHFWHWKQSPSTFGDPSSGSPMLEGHFFVHALRQSEVRYSPDIFWNMHCTLECRIPGLCEVQMSVTPEPVRIQLPSGRNFCRKIFPPDTFRQSEAPEWPALWDIHSV